MAFCSASRYTVGTDTPYANATAFASCVFSYASTSKFLASLCSIFLTPLPSYHISSLIAISENCSKLKQGFGRAIRTETDTCVIAVLDERAVPGQRHFEAMRATLPEMRVTDSLEEVVDFICRVKGSEYFREGAS